MSKERLKRRLEFKDMTGFSEIQLDIDIETGVFKKKKTKVKKVLFEKKSRK